MTDQRTSSAISVRREIGIGYAGSARRMVTTLG